MSKSPERRTTSKDHSIWPRTALARPVRLSRGEQTRNQILAQAIRTASEQGLEALTIGRMAGKLGMSKSGLFAHFGSKLKLQLATIEQAKAIFDGDVVQPAEGSTKGIVRLWNLCDHWLRHLEGRVFPSGYFFTGAFLEYAQRPGPLASSLREVGKAWLKSLKRAVEQAQGVGELNSEPSADKIAFELNAVLVGTHWAYLAEYRQAYAEARGVVLERLQGWATDRIPAEALKSNNTLKKYLRARARESSRK
jgi:AcrR family transcriptional regulator